MDGTARSQFSEFCIHLSEEFGLQVQAQTSATLRPDLIKLKSKLFFGCSLYPAQDGPICFQEQYWRDLVSSLTWEKSWISIDAITHTQIFRYGARWKQIFREIQLVLCMLLWFYFCCLSTCASLELVCTTIPAGCLNVLVDFWFVNCTFQEPPKPGDDHARESLTNQLKHVFNQGL